MDMGFIPEGSTSYHHLIFKNADGTLITPEAIRYKVTSGNGDILVEWTSITTDSTEIKVSSTVNTIGINGSIRFLTVEITFNTSEKLTGEIKYTLDDLVGIS